MRAILNSVIQVEPWGFRVLNFLYTRDSRSLFFRQRRTSAAEPSANVLRGELRELRHGGRDALRVRHTRRISDQHNVHHRSGVLT
jgi:hypothetical protein